MTFSINRFVRVTSAYNSGQISTVLNPSAVAVLMNGPALFTYASATDNAAAIAAANYFADAVYDLAVNDIIMAIGSDTAAILRIATIDREAGTITTVAF